jgi:hypothetical protein
LLLILGMNGAGKTTLASRLTTGQKRMIVDIEFIWKLSQLLNMNYLDAFENFCRKLYLRLEKNPPEDKLTLIFDDVDEFQPMYSNGLHSLIIREKHLNINLIIISRRPRFLPKIAELNAEKIYIFHLHPDDAEYIRRSYNPKFENPKEPFKYAIIENIIRKDNIREDSKKP